MLSQCPSIVTFNPGFACSFAIASSRIFNASGRRLKRSKSKCTSSNMIVARRTTVRLTLPVAVPPRLSRAVTVARTLPSWLGAVHTVFWAFALLNVPCGAVHWYISGSPSGSVPVAVRLLVAEGSTLQGLQLAVTDGERFGGGAATAGGGGVTVLVTVVVSLITRTRWRGGVTPGCQPTRISAPNELCSMSTPPTVRP